MIIKKRYYLVIGFSVLLMGAVKFSHETIPRTWEISEIDRSVLPFSDGIKTTFLPDSIYYSLEERKIYKTYPVYVPGKEPEDYYNWLKQQDPELVFNEQTLVTEEDWVQAGEAIFNSATVLSKLDSFQLMKLTQEHELLGLPATKEGVIPYYGYVIRKKGQVEMGIRSCGFCHSKVMDDGSLLIGAQGNMPVDGIINDNIQAPFKNFSNQKENPVRKSFEQDFSSPWKEYKTKEDIKKASDEEFLKSLGNTYGGVVHRTGTTLGEPVAIPDLYNLKERKYLDHSGRIVHSSIRDLMFYATLADPMEGFDKTAGHSLFPWPVDGVPNVLNEDQNRYSDAQLYALAKYLYTLEPPENPNVYPPEQLKRGKELFAREGCVTCHTPPLFTSNQLTPAIGFEIPEGDMEKYDIFPVSVETDPSHTMNSRRGTGYYKVPSLIGVWNRKALMHGGNITTLEELLDSARLQENFIPSGYRPGWRDTFPVKGHPFGFELNEDEKSDLIAYIKSL